MTHRNLFALAFLALPAIVGGMTAQPERGGAGRLGPSQRETLPAIDPDHDETLRQLKTAAAPTDAQWKTLQTRYAKFRADQQRVMRDIRRAVLGDQERRPDDRAGRPSGGPPDAGPEGRPGGPTDGPPPRQRPASPTAEQHEEIERQIAEKIEPLNRAFLNDVRGTLTESQRPKFDENIKGLDLNPPRPPGRPGEPDSRPGERPGAPANQSSKLPPSSVTISVKDGVRTIVANGIPDHKPGQFPGRGNPNAIGPQSYTLRMPEHPKPNDKPTPQRMDAAGVALNGVVFDPGTAEFWKNDRNSGWRQEAISPKTIAGDKMGLDSSNAHVQPNGAYHYHATPEGLIELLCKAKGVKDGEVMLQVGWAADGFPIYDHHCFTKADDAKSPLKELHSSYRLKKGQRSGAQDSPPGPGGAYDGTYTQDFEYVPGSGDLDECNGRFGVTPEFPEGTYYYVITGEFPFISRQFRGMPDPSFSKGPGRPGGANGRGGRPDGPPGDGPPGERRPGRPPAGGR